MTTEDLNMIVVSQQCKRCPNCKYEGKLTDGCIIGCFFPECRRRDLKPKLCLECCQIFAWSGKYLYNYYNATLMQSVPDENKLHCPECFDFGTKKELRGTYNDGSTVIFIYMGANKPYCMRCGNPHIYEY